MNVSKSSYIGVIGYKKCTCRNCMGIIPKKACDTTKGNKLPLTIKQLLKDSLLPKYIP